jgi:hypothetical protein
MSGGWKDAIKARKGGHGRKTMDMGGRAGYRGQNRHIASASHKETDLGRFRVI